MVDILGVPRLWSLQGCILCTGFVYSGYRCGSLTELTEVPGTGMEVLQNSQKCRVRAWKSYRTHRSAGYGHGSLCRTRRSSGYGYANVVPVLVPVPRVLCHGRTDLRTVPGTGMNVLRYG